MRRRPLFVGAAAVTSVVLAGFLIAQDRTPPAAERPTDAAAVGAAMEAFAAAFQGGNAKAAAALLTAGAELMPDDAAPVRGRAAIERAFAGYFARTSRARLTRQVESLRFVSRDSAIEEGRLTITQADGEKSSNRYSVLLVREDGKWLLAVIKEWPDEQEDLHDLDWLIGSWAAKRADAEVHTSYEWLGNKAFIQARFTVRAKDRTFTGVQIIGADPATGELRTWTFEADGGVGEGTVEQDGKHWVFETTTTMPNGSVLQATNVLVRVDRDTITWQPVNLTVDGEQYGDLPPVKVTRVKARP